TARRKEIAVRLALGASRFRIVRQLLTESVLLAMVSAAAGMALAVWLYQLLLSYQRYVIPSQTSFRDSLDLRVLGFAVFASVLAGLVFGLAPALQGSRPDLVPALKEANPSLDRREGRWSLRHLLVVLQIAVAMVVLAGAGLTIRSLINLFAINPGVNIENVLVVPVELPRAKYQNGSNQFFGPLTERLRALPGVAAVSTSIITPLSGSSGSKMIVIEGYQAQSPGDQPTNLTAAYNKVGPGYHEMMGIRILSGRGFTENDREGAAEVVVINEAMARRYFPNQNPVGRRMSMGPGMPWMEIIGVAADVKSRELTQEAVPHFDQPALQRPYGNFAEVLVRTRS
ncbi:MAG: ABC transporter permease, partial [Phycisphaerales bacterium]|nr:ABC transporter permease [Phycisphaerales bacterium]